MQYDEDGKDEEFDQYGLTMVLKDYLYADQSTRFQVCKNHFQRAVNDAKVFSEIYCALLLLMKFPPLCPLFPFLSVRY